MLVKKKKWEKISKKEKNQIINNYLYSNNEGQRLLIIGTIICLILIYLQTYMIILHILFLLWFYYKTARQAQLWYQKNNLTKPLLKFKKTYNQLNENEKKDVQRAYKLSKSTTLLDDTIVYLLFSYSLVFFLKGTISSGVLLAIFIFVDVFLLFDLKCKTKWYEKNIKNR